jgi:hypothetical protein
MYGKLKPHPVTRLEDHTASGALKHSSTLSITSVLDGENFQRHVLVALSSKPGTNIMHCSHFYN